MPHPRRKNVRDRKLHVERLEERALLAGDFELLADVNAATSSIAITPAKLTAVGPVVYFTTGDFTHGAELWKSDGTVAGTMLVKDINPGPTGSSPGFLTNVSGVLYFTANDGSSGIELWKSDGTVAGTVQVHDIRPGLNSSSPFYLTNHNGVLHFVANDGAQGDELWRSDGTPAGTVLVQDILPGSAGGFSRRATQEHRRFTSMGADFYFGATNGVMGFELWKSDGTQAGTMLVKDVFSGAGSGLTVTSGNNLMSSAGGTLFFAATDGVSGLELWKSDGTEAGTRLVKDIRLGTSGSINVQFNANSFANLAGVVYFSANDGATGNELWRSDGTEAGTSLVSDIAPGSASAIQLGGNDFYNSSFIAAGNQLYFSANDGPHGAELWKSDGTAAGTLLVKDVYSGPTSSQPRYFVEVNGALYFSATQTTTGREVWKSDGTEAGTVILKDVVPGTASLGVPNLLVNASGTLYFSHKSGLFTSDGTESGTLEIQRSATPSSNPIYLTHIDGIVYFSANDGVHGAELWRTDGTAAGSQLVADLETGAPSSTPRQLSLLGESLYFIRAVANSRELWRLAGPEQAPTLVQIISPGGVSYVGSEEVEVVGETIFFVVNDATSGQELWKTDGVTTALVKDIRTGTLGSFPQRLTNVNGVLYFMAYGSGGYELWKSDGSDAGTLRVKDIRPGSGHSYPTSLTNVGGTLYFKANDGLTGQELWKSDGTEGGTTRVKDIVAGLNGASIGTFMFNLNGTVYFAANDGASGSELWRSDGTDAGTYRVLDLNPGTASSSPSTFANFGGVLYFAANDGVNGFELWRSDGTETGTILVKDVNAGLVGSSISGLLVHQGKLYFSASDGVNGQELWRTDGTQAGTQLVQDFTGDSGGSSPVPFDFGGRLVVIATTEATGRELFIEVIPGDFNRDNVVTTADYDFWRDNFGATTGVGLKADANRDGLVDAADYTIWRDNYVPPIPTATTAISAANITPPLARDLALPPQQNTAPIANSPPRRTDLLLSARDCAARDWAFADLGRDENPSPITTPKPAARNFAPLKSTFKTKL